MNLHKKNDRLKSHAFFNFPKKLESQLPIQVISSNKMIVRPSLVFDASSLKASPQSAKYV